MALKNHLVFWSIVIGVFVVDRITKMLILNYVPLGGGIEVIPFLSFAHVLNTGTLFGLFKNANLFFIGFASVISAIIIAIYRRYKLALQILLALILGGALGNLLDRLLYGAVIDFIDVHFWPVFNVADSAITIAVAVLLIREFVVKNYRKL